MCRPYGDSGRGKPLPYGVSEGRFILSWGTDTGRPVEGSLRFQSPPSSASHALGTFPLEGGRLSGGCKGRPYVSNKLLS